MSDPPGLLESDDDEEEDIRMRTPDTQVRRAQKTRKAPKKRRDAANTHLVVGSSSQDVSPSSPRDRGMRGTSMGGRGTKASPREKQAGGKVANAVAKKDRPKSAPRFRRNGGKQAIDGDSTRSKGKENLREEGDKDEHKREEDEYSTGMDEEFSEADIPLPSNDDDDSSEEEDEDDDDDSSEDEDDDEDSEGESTRTQEQGGRGGRGEGGGSEGRSRGRSRKKVRPLKGR